MDGEVRNKGGLENYYIQYHVERRIEYAIIICKVGRRYDNQH
jgi:hypothetical protein